MNFKCYTCNSVFKAKGKKKEFIDPIFGPCSKWVAQCPGCKGETSEYDPNPGKSKSISSAPSCGMEGGCQSCKFNH